MLYDTSLLFIYFIYHSLLFPNPISLSCLSLQSSHLKMVVLLLCVCPPAGAVLSLPTHCSHDLLALIQLVIILTLRPEELHLLAYQRETSALLKLLELSGLERHAAPPSGSPDNWWANQTSTHFMKSRLLPWVAKMATIACCLMASRPYTHCGVSL